MMQIYIQFDKQPHNLTTLLTLQVNLIYFFFEMLQQKRDMNNTPTKNNSATNEAFAQNLYEVPQCTICLQELTEDMGSLSCGHVFHINCITQNFEYRGSCPNCQKRSCAKEIRYLHFPLVHNNKSMIELRKLLSNLNVSEKKQVESLFKDLRKISQSQERLKNQKVQNEIQIKNQAQKISSLLDQMHKRKNQSEMLKRQNLAIISNANALSQEVNSLEKSTIFLRLEVQKHQKMQKEYQQCRKLKRLMSEHSHEIVRYKNQLQSKNTPLDQMCRIVFDMLLMKNLQLLKIKEKVNEFPQRISQIQNENRRLKDTIDILKRQAREINQKKVIDRRKYEDLKVKFRNLCEKARQKGIKDNDIPDLEDSQTFLSMMVNKTPHVPHVPQISVIPEKTLTMPNVIRKPMLNQSGSSTFGGFAMKKKDDKLRNFV